MTTSNPAPMVCVPVEPTEAMIAAMAECYDPTWGYPHGSGIDVTWAKKSYAAMLAAAAPAPARAVQGEAVGNLCIYTIWAGKDAQVQNLRFDHLPPGDYPIYTQPPAPAEATPAMPIAANEGDKVRAERYVRTIATMPTEIRNTIMEALAAYDPERVAKCGNTVAASGDVERSISYDDLMAEQTPAMRDGVEARYQELRAALRSQGQAVVVDAFQQFWEAVMFWRAQSKHHYAPSKASENEREADRLLAIIESNGAGQ